MTETTFEVEKLRLTTSLYLDGRYTVDGWWLEEGTTMRSPKTLENKGKKVKR